MTWNIKCPLCRRQVLYIRKWSYIAPLVSPQPITSVNECCKRCFQDIKFITINKPSLRHHYKRLTMRLLTYLKTYDHN